MSSNKTNNEDTNDEGDRKRPRLGEEVEDAKPAGDTTSGLATTAANQANENDTQKKRSQDSTTTGGSDEADAGILYNEFYAAQRQLETAQTNMAGIRERIRSRGLFAPDSLLHCLSVGGDGSPILFAVLQFLSVRDVARCEMTCKFFQNKQTKRECWSRMAAKLESPHDRSPSAVAEKDPRKMVIRHHLASALAERVSGLGYEIQQHLYTFQRRARRFSFYAGPGGDGGFEDARVEGACEGCEEFPDKLDFGVFRRETTANYELYVRFSRTFDNKLFAQGFLPFSLGDFLDIPLDGLDLSKWTKMVKLMNNVTGEMLNDNLLESCMRELTATIVAVNKTRLEATLVAAQCNFAGDGSNNGLSGIDNLEGHGFCVPANTLAARSHDDLRTIRRGDTWETRYSNVKLSMMFDSDDPENEGEKRQWFWKLSCTFWLRED